MAEYEILTGDIVCAKYVNGEVEIIDEKRAPLFLHDFKSWVSARAISEQRGYTSRSIKSASGISANADAYETSLKANCACITDDYWVRAKGSSLTYADVNCDAYDGKLVKLALGIESDPYKFRGYNTPNPELTNIGNSDKAWFMDSQGTRWLYKRQPLRECVNEIIASKVAKKLGINTVDYEMVATTNDAEIGRWGIVKSKDFTQGRNINLESAEFILKHFNTDEYHIRENADIFRLYGCEKEYLDIIYLDIITGNPDRHSRNYGVLRDRKTGDVVGLAPNFDNNFAFRADLTMKEFSEVATEYEYNPPLLTDDDIKDIRAEMENANEQDATKALNIVKWKQRSVSEAIEKASHNTSNEAVSQSVNSNGSYVRPHLRNGKPVKGYWRRRRR